ncbi:hypothetical protein GGI04_002090 [Coemansia thaxteri]|uniref:Uncharacterized protein n=1 Tax=Coemansia thaxteri TaxID=2663907 RepID=A0A9W8BBL5_9FUNG|nr:hypothetical protein H4R26_003938 [Coemansia thaxteri]KAJ2005839.1 hypothetical protein GGI04_002090 [Coemansia thaxteri]KAJ2472942.1 hypothetical protein GGI02_001228 [Coemansia sp. RSA 2322]KAJ2479555.1 hypothetical protein EV174_003982 [Coemansia sp. RSA 2320]
MGEDGASQEEQLLAACMTDQSDLVRELLQDSHPVDVNFTNSLGYTALHYAAQTGSVDCMRLLVAVQGVNPNIQDSLDKDTPLHKALVHCDSSETALELTRLLLTAGADPRITNEKRQRPVTLTEPEEEDIRRLLVQATLAAETRRTQPDDSSDGGSCSSD